MLTRDLIASRAHLDLLKDGDHASVWTESQLAESLQSTLAMKPKDVNDIWVFAYGSLIWNPMIQYDERQWATLPGWRRGFTLRMTLGRGSTEHPGRMLAIQPGTGSIRGVALRVSSEHLSRELELLWRREMLTGAYTPTWVNVTLDDGSPVVALTFASNPKHPSYEEDDSAELIAPLIASACGPYGSNKEYVTRLHHELTMSGSEDTILAELVRALKKIIS